MLKLQNCLCGGKPRIVMPGRRLLKEGTLLKVSLVSGFIHYYYYYYFFNLRTAAFKAYCAIWVRCSNFRHRASPPESTQRRKVELWATNVRNFSLNADFHVTFRDLLHALKLWHGTNGFTSPLKEGVLRIFSPWKILTASGGLNPQTWVLDGSTLPLDHRSHWFITK